MRVYKPKRSSFYWCDFTLPGQPRARFSLEVTTLQQAKLKAADAFAKARDNGSVDILLRKAPVLENFAVEFLQWVEASQSIGKHSRLLYSRGWRLLKDTPVAKMPMDKISNIDCQMIQFPGGPSNANSALKTLKRMFRIAKEMKRFYGEFPKIVLREERPRSVQISPTHALLIDSHWKPEERSESSRDAFRVLCSSGMRPSECFAMEWQYLDLERAVYCNPDGKTESSQREAPLYLPPFNCVEILKARHERMGYPGNGWIFPSPTAQCGHLTTINKPFNRARKLAGLPKEMVLYTVRHGACTAVAEVTTLKNAMQLMGHSDVKTALRYQHPDSKEVAERLWERMKTQSDAKFLEKVGVKL